MMPESEVAPAVRLGEPLTVFDANVDPVELAVEIPSAGRFFPRAIWKSRFKNTSQLFYKDRSFGKCTRLQIGIYVFFLDVHMMIFGKVRFSIVEAVRGQGSSDKDPLAKDRWVRQLQLALRIKDYTRLFSLSRNRSGLD